MTMKRAIAAAAAASALLGLTACTTYDDGYGYGIGGMGPKQTVGTLAGAGVGALIGSQIGEGSGKLAAVAIGTLAGAYLGSELGQSLDRADQQYAYNAQHRALHTGRPASWNNPQSGHYGYVQPGPYVQAGPGYGRDCRQYSHTVYIDGRPQTAYGTACREPDGSWRIANL